MYQNSALYIDATCIQISREVYSLMFLSKSTLLGGTCTQVSIMHYNYTNKYNLLKKLLKLPSLYTYTMYKCILSH